MNIIEKETKQFYYSNQSILFFSQMNINDDILIIEMYFQKQKPNDLQIDYITT